MGRAGVADLEFGFILGRAALEEAAVLAGAAADGTCRSGATPLAVEQGDCASNCSRRRRCATRARRCACV